MTLTPRPRRLVLAQEVFRLMALGRAALRWYRGTYSHDQLSRTIERHEHEIRKGRLKRG